MVTRVSLYGGILLVGFGAGLALAANIWCYLGGDRGRQRYYVCQPHE